MICRRCIVTGKVQGVWFRETTRRRGLELGLSGSAVNLRDGSVEVIVQGRAEDVESLCDWLRQGPPTARVQSVRCQSWEGRVAPGFSTG